MKIINGKHYLETKQGDIELSEKEFVKGRAIRNITRLLVCLVAGFIELYVFTGKGVFTIGVGLLMVGWRLKTGW